jgi:ribosomal protein L7/L12
MKEFCKLYPVILLLIAFCLMSNQGTALAQEVVHHLSPAKQNAKESIISLNSGVLVVRLPGYRNKIEALKKMLQSTDLSLKEKAQTQKQLDKTIKERTEEHQAYANAFSQFYSFSDVVFMFDHDTPGFLNGKVTFMDSHLNDDPSLKVLERDYFFLDFGRTKESSLHALIVLDSDKKQLPKPFPGYVLMSGFSEIWSKLVGSSHSKWQVKRLNKKLTSFHEKVFSTDY